MRSGGGTVHFRHNRRSHWIQNEKVPELGVAHDESYLREVYSRHGLSDPPDIYFGAWCGRPGYSGLCSQDTVVTRKL
jgi:hypothetical protein